MVCCGHYNYVFDVQRKDKAESESQGRGARIKDHDSEWTPFPMRLSIYELSRHSTNP